MSILADWLWPTVSLLLAILWLWTLLRQRQEHVKVSPSASGLTHQRVEAEDVLKAAYAQQETDGRLSLGGLARSVGLPESLARQGMEALLAFGWVEEHAHRA